MAYEMQGFEDGMTLNAEHLINMERGIMEKADADDFKKETWTIVFADGSTVEKAVWTA